MPDFDLIGDAADPLPLSVESIFPFGPLPTDPMEPMEDAATTAAAMVSDPLTERQEIILSALQVCSATLSLIGSCLIVFKILRRLYKNWSTTPYDRIIMGLSSCDIVASAVYAASPFLLPRETSQRVWAMGTDRTCQTLGFLTQLSALWAIWYNGVLSFYYLLTVRFRVKRRVLYQRYELWMHLSGAVFFPVTALVGLFGNWYGEQALTIACWNRNVPTNCDAATGVCTGDATEIVGYVFGGVPMLTTFIAIVVNNVIIYRHVRKTLLGPSSSSMCLKHRHHRPRPSSITTGPIKPNDDEDDENDDIENSSSHSNNHDSSHDQNRRRNSHGHSHQSDPGGGSGALSLPSSTTSRSSDGHRSVQEQLAREAAIQGFLYVSTFLLTCTPVFVLVVLDGSMNYDVGNKGEIYPLLVLNSLLVPLQGFFNVFIYVKPSYKRFSNAHPDERAFAVLKRALFETNVPRLSTSPSDGNLQKLSALRRRELSSQNGGSGKSAAAASAAFALAMDKKHSLMKSRCGSNFETSLNHIAEEDGVESEKREHDLASCGDVEDDLDESRSSEEHPDVVSVEERHPDPRPDPRPDSPPAEPAASTTTWANAGGRWQKPGNNIAGGGGLIHRDTLSIGRN